MYTRTVKLELPSLDRLTYPNLLVIGNALDWNVVNVLVALGREQDRDGNHMTGDVLREAAKLLDALRIGLQKDDYEPPEIDTERLTDGETAILREIRLIRLMVTEEIGKIRERRDARTTQGRYDSTEDNQAKGQGE